MTFGVARTVAVLLASLTAFTGRQGVDDPALRAAVEQFFAAQQAEDVSAYLALWSASVRPPTPEQLKYVFDAGDDKSSEIAILATYPAIGSRSRASQSDARSDHAVTRSRAATFYLPLDDVVEPRLRARER